MEQISRETIKIRKENTEKGRKERGRSGRKREGQREREKLRYKRWREWEGRETGT